MRYRKWGSYVSLFTTRRAGQPGGLAEEVHAFQGMSLSGFLPCLACFLLFVSTIKAGVTDSEQARWRQSMMMCKPAMSAPLMAMNMAEADEGQPNESTCGH